MELPKLWKTLKRFAAYRAALKGKTSKKAVPNELEQRILAQSGEATPISALPMEVQNWLREQGKTPSV